jgi:hypothetical protein
MNVLKPFLVAPLLLAFSSLSFAVEEINKPSSRAENQVNADLYRR